MEIMGRKKINLLAKEMKSDILELLLVSNKSNNCMIMRILTHFEVRDDALILKNVAFDWLAIHLPKKKRPF